jgi:ABC-2 type transport system ATP-binding protein
MIEVIELSKSFGTKQVLNNINLTFLEGNVYGLVGENGAGKTTLFRCMAGLEDHEGAVKSRLAPLKNHLGLLVTEPYFFSKITGKEYIRLICNARNNKISDIESRNIFDLPLDQYASTYSTGMKKKLAITAILLQQNKYFILDEPFNGIDIQSNIIISEIIHKLKALDKIVIISSHIFSTLGETCDEIHLLVKGEIIKTVSKLNFSQLEAEMKEATVLDKIERLELK